MLVADFKVLRLDDSGISAVTLKVVTLTIKFELKNSDTFCSVTELIVVS